MKEIKDEQVTSISKAKTLEEIVDFWDTHSLADHWDERMKSILRYGCSGGAV